MAVVVPTRSERRTFQPSPSNFGHTIHWQSRRKQSRDESNEAEPDGDLERNAIDIDSNRFNGVFLFRDGRRQVLDDRRLCSNRVLHGGRPPRTNEPTPSRLSTKNGKKNHRRATHLAGGTLPRFSRSTRTFSPTWR